jgi:hypothetical protein
MSEHYYNSKDLAKFGNVADFQKELGEKFFLIMAKCLRTVN